MQHPSLKPLVDQQGAARRTGRAVQFAWGLLLAVLVPAALAQGNAPAPPFDPSQWKITLPDGTERDTQWLMAGNTEPDAFYYDDLGAMVFRSPNIAGSTPNSTYSRSELRGLLHGATPGIPHRGYTRNNWVFSTSSLEVKTLMGGIDGTMEAILKVDRVSDTGDAARVGRVIVGQIHASDDEPLRLYYRKLPDNQRGSVYFAHQTPGGSDTWYELIGSRSNTAEDPVDGIALGEPFGYTIAARGLALTVTIVRPGKPNVERTIAMAPGYTDDWMYFKAGVYNQNNTGSATDYAQATFFNLRTHHDAPPVVGDDHLRW